MYFDAELIVRPIRIPGNSGRRSLFGETVTIVSSETLAVMRHIHSEERLKRTRPFVVPIQSDLEITSEAKEVTCNPSTSVGSDI